MTEGEGRDQAERKKEKKRKLTTLYATITTFTNRGDDTILIRTQQATPYAFSIRPFDHAANATAWTLAAFPSDERLEQCSGFHFA